MLIIITYPQIFISNFNYYVALIPYSIFCSNHYNLYLKVSRKQSLFSQIVLFALASKHCFVYTFVYLQTDKQDYVAVVFFWENTRGDRYLEIIYVIPINVTCDLSRTFSFCLQVFKLFNSTLRSIASNTDIDEREYLSFLMFKIFLLLNNAPISS